MNKTKCVYVISDLHIGGEYGAENNSKDRGFRICKNVPLLVKFITELTNKGEEQDVELVINGDFIDFLAEVGSIQNDGTPCWEPFIYDPDVAVERLENIAKREKEKECCDLFGALAIFLEKGNKLTILLGNHDIELSFPKVRQKLKELLRVQGNQNFAFIYDGEAYSFGEVIIEHGNQYDIWNQVDYDALRMVRSIQSRGKIVSTNTFKPIPGSSFVAHIMNHAKKEFPFVDLLKPETQAAVPILLALNPSYITKLRNLIQLGIKAETKNIVKKTLTGQGMDIGANIPNKFLQHKERVPDSQYLSVEEILQTSFNSSIDVTSFLNEIGYITDAPSQIKNSTIDIGTWPIKTIAANIISNTQSKLSSLKLDILRKVLEPLERDKSFDISFEADQTCRNQAQKLASEGNFKYVIFGHTHLAKKDDLGNGITYFNSGTWTDLIKLPEEVFSKDKTIKEDVLRTFVTNLEQGNLEGWISCDPYYIKLELNIDNRVLIADLYQYAVQGLV